MKSPMPWFCLIAVANTGIAFADDGLDAYREGNYIQAAKMLSDSSMKDPIVQYYMGRMRLYGYGQLKNNTLAIQHFKQAAEKGFLPAQQIMGRYALLEEKNPEQALYWFKKAANANDIEAQMYCAAAYQFGVGVKQNPDVAKRYYIAAAKNGNAIAQYTLAQSFLETRQLANKKLGLIWLNKAVEQKNPEAQVMMGNLYASGSLVPKDLPKARELVGLAVAQGYVPAIYQMGEIERQENNLTDAKEWYTKAAKARYSLAEIALSKLYAQEKNPKDAFLWMLQAAQNGSSEAQLALATMYEKGDGIDADENLAKEWRVKAAQTGKMTPDMAQAKAVAWLSNGKYSTFTESPYRLNGIFSAWKNTAALKQNDYNQAPQMPVLTRDELYKPRFVMINPSKIAISEYYNALVASLGELPKDKLVFSRYSVAPDEAKQFKQLVSKAVLGDSDAQFELAQLYETGTGTQKNIDEAIKYYQLAAVQQDLRAEYNLALIYLEGRGVTADISKGMELLQDTAFKGNTYAQYALAGIYEQGFYDSSDHLVIQPNHDQAMAMYGLAAASDYGMAQYRLAEIMVREKQTDMSRLAVDKRNELIKYLYQGAFHDGVEQAQLPLAFFNAMDSSQAKQEKAFLVAKKEAESGSVQAALLLGLMYDCGISVATDPAEAVHWYQAAESNPVAAFALGTHLSQGSGVSKDVEKGRALLQKAADADFSYANLNLAVMDEQDGKPFVPELDKAYALGNYTAGVLLADYYLSKANSEQDMKQARDIYEHIAESGDREGQLKLGYMYQQGLGGRVDMASAEKWYTLAAEQGQPIAQYLLGHVYQMGWLDKQPDYEQAKKWYSSAQTKYAPAAVGLGFIYDTVNDDYTQALTDYEQAAQLNSPIGQFNAGLIYEKGKGRPVDLAKATDLYIKAADQGHAQAMVQLADIYLISSKDQQKALQWYKKAADLGDRDAMYQLGLLSETGVATKLDYPDAIKYYEQAADKGNANAKLALARMYQYGLGAKKDLDKSFKLYEELADQNNAYAQYQLAMFYYDGSVAERMPEKAKKLLEKAEENGSIQARNALRSMSDGANTANDQVEVKQKLSLTDKPADLMYLDALNTWNCGDEPLSRMMLSNIITQYPDYVPAKRTIEQVGQDRRTGSLG